MKVSKRQFKENRERILHVAARLFREKGFDGIGVADLMKTAGLTHGAFYGYFSSKEDLVLQASATCLDRSLDTWRCQVDRAAGSPLLELTATYLSAAHRDDPGSGCLFASLGPDVARYGPSVRRPVTEGLCAFIDILSTLVGGESPDARRREAITTFAGLLGAIMMARMVDDLALSDEILHSVNESLTVSG
jgi:TetR/AcrR family transcriptional repressor of nem operon